MSHYNTYCTLHLVVCLNIHVYYQSKRIERSFIVLSYVFRNCQTPNND